MRSLLFSKTVTLLVVLAGAVMLLYVPLQNNFPLTYPDTGTYIRSGFENFMPFDRPMMYGYWIRHSSMRESLWLTVFFQAILVSYCIYLFFKHFSSQKRAYLLTLFAAIFLSVTTAVSQKTGTLMPDIFSPVLAICFLLLLFARNLSLAELIFTSLLFVLSESFHNSHHMISVFVIVVLFAVWLLRKNLRPLFSVFRMVLCGLLIGSSVLLTCIVHYANGGGFKLTNGRHVFLMNRFVETGVLEKFLKENCGKKNYVLCPYQDNLTHVDFLWDPNSPLYKTGGWYESEAGYDEIINDMLSKSKYRNKFIIKCIENTFKQFMSFELDITAENTQQMGGTPPYDLIRTHFKHQLNEYGFSLQNRNMLNYIDLNRRQTIVIFFSFFLLLVYVLKKEIRHNLPAHFKMIVITILIFLIANAVVCGSLSTICPRYQNRVVWLVPLVVIVMIYELSVVRDIRKNLIKKLFRDSD